MKPGEIRALRSWVSLFARCLDDASIGYKNYGARGITICDRWYDFRSFLADMDERPEGTTLDRIDNNRGYELANCRWATKREQARNTRRNRRVTVGGVEQLQVDAARALGVAESTILRRSRAGMDVSQRRPLGKLTVAQQDQVRRKLAAGARVTDLAREFGVRRQAIALYRETAE